MKKCFYFPTWKEIDNFNIISDNDEKYLIINNKEKFPIEEESNECEFSTLQGETIIDFKINDEKTEIIITTINRVYKMYHRRQCCESVYLESITDDYKDILIGEEILSSEESKSSGKSSHGSETWTFYKLRTKKGYVDMRWYGESNGYYSESVDILYYNINNNINHLFNYNIAVDTYGDYVCFDSEEYIYYQSNIIKEKKLKELNQVYLEMIKEIEDKNSILAGYGINITEYVIKKFIRKCEKIIYNFSIPIEFDKNKIDLDLTDLLNKYIYKIRNYDLDCTRDKISLEFILEQYSLYLQNKENDWEECKSILINFCKKEL